MADKYFDNQYKQAEAPTCGPSTQGQYAGQLGCTPTQRRTAWDALRDLVSAARLRANQLEALQRALPQELPFAADEALQKTFDRERNLITNGIYAN